ncbi:hypothetical protein C7974DRAFT_440114, partial [Boeremia exigua]|uniref:uncharacterized protein n=1 Tax=Boeremia exigua TaxID=749465 RepID=UPI001E8EE56D
EFYGSTITTKSLNQTILEKTLLPNQPPPSLHNRLRHSLRLRHRTRLHRLRDGNRHRLALAIPIRRPDRPGPPDPLNHLLAPPVRHSPDIHRPAEQLAHADLQHVRARRTRCLPLHRDREAAAHGLVGAFLGTRGRAVGACQAALVRQLGGGGVGVGPQKRIGRGDGLVEGERGVCGRGLEGGQRGVEVWRGLRDGVHVLVVVGVFVCVRVGGGVGGDRREGGGGRGRGGGGGRRGRGGSRGGGGGGGNGAHCAAERDEGGEVGRGVGDGSAEGLEEGGQGGVREGLCAVVGRGDGLADAAGAAGREVGLPGGLGGAGPRRDGLAGGGRLDGPRFARNGPVFDAAEVHQRRVGEAGAVTPVVAAEIHAAAAELRAAGDVLGGHSGGGGGCGGEAGQGQEEDELHGGGGGAVVV